MHRHQRPHEQPKAALQLLSPAGLYGLNNGIVQPLFIAANQGEHDGVFVREILVKGPDAYASIRCNRVGIEAAQSIRLQNASTGFKNDAYRLLRPGLSRHFTGFQYALSRPASAIVNASFICEHLLVF